MADCRRVMIYGGYGATGKWIAALVARHLGADIVIAGRNGAEAQRAAEALAAEQPERRFTTSAFECTDRSAARAALADVDLLIVAAPIAEHLDILAEAALAAGADLIDISVRGLAADKLMPFDAAAREAGRVFITQAGFHPGILGAIMRALALRFSRIEAIDIGMVMRFDLRDANSAREIIPMVAEDRSRIIDGGKLRQASYRDARPFAFGQPFGRRSCFPLEMREVERVGVALGLDHAGTYAAGFNWFIDYIVFPLLFVAQGLGGERLAYRLAPLFYWGNRWFSAKGGGLEMRGDAKGEIAGAPVRLSLCLTSPDAVAFTAQCVLAAVKQMKDGALAAPGVWLMGEKIDPEQLFKDLEALGTRVWIESA